LLVDLSVFGIHDDVSVLLISSTMYIHNLSSFIDNESTIESEELPPS
jgi:hypothetical protein